MQYLSCIRKSKQDFECQNEIFGPNSNVKIGIAIFDPILMTKSDIKRRTAIIGPISKVKIGLFDIWPKFCSLIRM